MAENATAQLEARFSVCNGHTQMSRCYATAPLKIAKTFARADGLDVCLMDASPGLLAGDDYRLSWQLGPGARVFVTTQGFTRVHPSQANPCRLQQSIVVSENALFEYFPEPLMMYKEASLRNECRVDIAEGGAVLMAEIVCAGRIGKGEEFLFHSLQNRLKVYAAGELVYITQNRHCPAVFEPGRVGAWGKFTHLGSFSLFTTKLSKAAFEALRDEVRLVLNEDSSKVWGGVSLLGRQGMVVNMLGARAHDLQLLTQRLRLLANDCIR